ncbi:hypothetical protein M9458_008485, partial [Cirrhinus mrigala]
LHPLSLRLRRGPPDLRLRLGRQSLRALPWPSGSSVSDLRLSVSASGSSASCSASV